MNTTSTGPAGPPGAGPTHHDGVRRRILDLPASRIREVARLGMGRPDVIPLWFGEPDVPTPEFICAAAARALRAGRTFYTPNRGIPELREALAAYMSRLHGVPIGAERITVTASGMNAIMLAMQCLVEPGDNVVVTSPLWPNVLATVEIMGGEPRTVPLEEAPAGGWRLDLDRLLDACDGRTRAVFINSPSNPTGWTMPREEQRALLEACRRRGIWLVADEVYNRIVYAGRVAPSFAEHAAPEDRVVVLNSFSKSWAMTGWRIGWITAPDDLGPVLEKMNEFNVAGAATFAQHAAVTALEEGEPFVAASVERYRQGRDLVHGRLAAHPRVRLARPEAAFYAFFAVDGMTDSLAFAKDLLRTTGVGLAPGAAFGPGGEGYLRLCFASSPETLTRALDRLEGALGQAG